MWPMVRRLECLGFAADHRPHSSSANRFTAGASGFLLFDPTWRATGSISRILPLRDDTFEAQPAGVMEDIRGAHSIVSPAPLARERWRVLFCAAAQIIAVEFDQVEGVEENTIIVVPVTDAVERRYPILAARDRLSVDDAGPVAQLGDRLDDERESIGQVITRPAIELHPFAVLAGDDPKTVVLDFVQPLLASRRLRSIDGEARRNEPSRQSTETR